jgi:hypothetical protein
MKNEISEKENTELSVVSAFAEDANSGLENMTSEDLTIPRIKILQAMSPEVNKREGKYVEGADAGDVINTVTNVLYNEDNELVVLPVSYKRLFLEWQPRESGGGLVTSYDDQSILSKTTKNERGQDVLENGNYIQTSANHFVIVLNKDGSYDQAVMPMAGTQLKKSRTWNSVMASIKFRSGDKVFTPPSFSHKYSMKTVQESNDRGTWFGWGITNLGPLVEDEMFFYDAAKTFAMSIGDVAVTNSGNSGVVSSSEDTPF